AAGVGAEHVALVQLLGERDEAGERTRERDLVGDRHRAEVVEHGVDGGRRAEGADREHLPFLGHAQGSRPVLEVARRTALVADGRPLRQRGDPALRLVEIDRQPGVVREEGVAAPLLHRRLGVCLGKRHGPSVCAPWRPAGQPPRRKVSLDTGPRSMARKTPQVPTLVVAVAFPHGALGSSRRALWLYLFVATASHGCLDALTDGGLGVAFFSPFSNARYFFPVRPIRVSPIGLQAFMSGDELTILASEARWVWLPSALLMASAGASLTPSPTIATVPPAATSASIRSTLSSGRRSASTSRMPRLRATASATGRVSPVRRIVRMPKRPSAATARCPSGRTVSAMA